MKRTLTTILLALGFASTAALADIAVYSGKTVKKTVSSEVSGKKANSVISTYVVIDLEASQAQTIEYFLSPDKKKTYTVTDPFATTETTVTDDKGKVTTVFAIATTEVDGTETTFNSALISGTLSSVKLGGEEALDLPKQVKGTSFTLETDAAAPENNTLVTGSTVLKLDLKRSKKSNSAEPVKTLSDVVADIVAELEKKKYEAPAVE